MTKIPKVARSGGQTGETGNDKDKLITEESTAKTLFEAQLIPENKARDWKQEEQNPEGPAVQVAPRRRGILDGRGFFLFQRDLLVSGLCLL